MFLMREHTHEIKAYFLTRLNGKLYLPVSAGISPSFSLILLFHTHCVFGFYLASSVLHFLPFRTVSETKSGSEPVNIVLLFFSKLKYSNPH